MASYSQGVAIGLEVALSLAHRHLLRVEGVGEVRRFLDELESYVTQRQGDLGRA